MNYGKNMLLYSGYWQTNDGSYNNTFKIMPATLDCPYAEAIYDTNSAMLVVISKDTSEKLQMVPILNSLGDIMTTSARKTKGYKEQRIRITMPNEFILSERKEIESFISTFCLNTDDVDYKKVMDDTEARKKKELTMTMNDIKQSKDEQNKISKNGVSGHSDKRREQSDNSKTVKS